MGATKTITLDDVRRVAELANLELTAEEETRIVRDLGSILGYVDQLNQLDTTDVAPMAQVGEVLGGQSGDSVPSLRDDALRPSLDRDVVLANAPESDGAHFKVPKVIER
jgi:aspartyl-tRNA(Asn)/glutamyl-tRNA(Gln) amidotransferase subunit C